MLDHAALSPQALDYFQSLPISAQVVMTHSSLTLRTLEDLRAFEARSLSGVEALLRRNLPDAGGSPSTFYSNLQSNDFV